VSSNTPTFGPPEFSVGVVPAFALIRLAEVAGRAWTKSLAWPGLAWPGRRGGRPWPRRTNAVWWTGSSPMRNSTPRVFAWPRTSPVV
jgi:hypothetical protein